LWRREHFGNHARFPPTGSRVSSPHPRLDQLLRRFAARVRAQIESNRLIQHGIDPDDVEQEVRIRLWKALERDPNADFPASYIQKVVVTVMVDALRRAQSRAADALPDPDEGEVARSGRPA
jgi:DNA-directed RNA polymerase specialized sigma24 family protein